MSFAVHMPTKSQATWTNHLGCRNLISLWALSNLMIVSVLGMHCVWSNSAVWYSSLYPINVSITFTELLRRESQESYIFLEHVNDVWWCWCSLVSSRMLFSCLIKMHELPCSALWAQNGNIFEPTMWLV